MHLLLVEDDERLARVLTRLLEEDRHVVEHAPGRPVRPRARRRARRARRGDPRHRAAGHVRPRRRAAPPRATASSVSILMLTARDTVNDRVAGPRRRRRRLRRQAVRLRGGGRATAGARPPRRARPAPPGAEARGRRRSRSTRPRRRVTVERPPRRPQPARVLAARVRSCGTPARRSPATSCWTTPGRSASRSRPTPSTPTSTTCAPSSAPPARRIETVRGVGYRLADG